MTINKTSTSNKTTQQIVFAAVSAALGAFAFFKTQQVVKPFMDPLVELCQQSNNNAAQDDHPSLHPFEGKLGGAVFVCIATQFMYALTKHVAGFLTWMTVAAIFLPVTTIMAVESGRRDAQGPIRYPTLLGLLIQLLGPCVIFSLIFVPSYLYGRGRGSVSTTRLYASVVLALPGVALSVAIFYVSTASYAWTVCAGLVAGPVLALLSLVYWKMTPPESDTLATLQNSHQVTTYVYLFNGLVAFTLYAAVVYTVQLVYGSDFAGLYKTIWSDAHPVVKFMTVDAVILYLSVLCYIGMQSLPRLLETVVLTPLMGPGAAPALVLAKIQVECAEEVQQAAKVKRS